MNAIVTILQTFDLEAGGETVCRVEAGLEFPGTVADGRVWFWVEDATKRLHKATLPVDSELIQITMNKTRSEK